MKNHFHCYQFRKIKPQYYFQEKTFTQPKLKEYSGPGGATDVYIIIKIKN